MQNILLANIGNSNIKHSWIDKSTRAGTFKVDTQNLLEHYDTEEENITLAMLPEWIVETGNTNAIVYLFGSNNPDAESRSNQDTLFAVQIVARKLANLFPALTIFPEIVDVRSVDGDGLMVYYRKKLISLATIHPDAHFWLLDGGGTPQQKFALKINLEYLGYPSKVHVPELVEIGGKKETEIVHQPSYEYKRIINQIQARSLIKHYNYEGALLVLQQENGIKVSSSLLKVVSLATLLKANNFLDYRTEHSRLVGKSGPIHEMLSFVNPTAEIFPLQLQLEIGRAYAKARNFNSALLVHYNFYEGLFNFFIKAEMDAKGLAKLYKEIRKPKGWGGLARAIQENEVFSNLKFTIKPPPQADKNCTIVIGETEFDHFSLPFQKALVLSLEVPQITEVESTFKEGEINDLRGLRNKVAHEGKAISEKQYTRFLAGFNKWYNIMQLPKELMFNQLNTHLEELLAQ